MFQTLAMDPARDGQPTPGNWELSLERSGGDHAFTQRFTPDKVATGARDGDATEQAPQELAKGMMRALLVKNHITVRVHGPSIGETNGTVNEQKTTVEWKLPLAELVDGPAEGRELRAVVHGAEPLWLWLVVLGVPLVVLGLAIAAARRRRAA
ncbi:hypothetical protein [Pyxidicoccus xibeiensis]|uniref:hypothetical protein n=1 Tax=Pyxidicoccus xibeiensis TaxID=2906759 RepID=UPI0020A718E0|nr:hypothetical protein [Pyxidicoccus xibeiensis]MCP3141668.1 hypothetical protein [Pyxidicoccus xibeiensis]